MKRIQALLAICCIVLLAVSFAIPLAAQDATATPEGGGDTSGETGMLTNCDSSLILLTGLAQRYFGFNADGMIDMSTFEYGQFTPLFDMSTVPTGDTGSTDAAATDTGSTDASATQDPNAVATDTGTTGNVGSVTLNPPLIADEDPFCMQLRSSLENFFATEFGTADWDMRFRSGMSGTSTSGN